jgi:hypothetical protein
LSSDRISAKFVARNLVRLYPEQAVDVQVLDIRSARKRLTALPEIPEFTLKAPR